MRALEGGLGPNYGKASDDPYWDCIHVVDPDTPEQTLCGLPLDRVAQACDCDNGLKLGMENGCWSCLERVDQIVGEVFR